jgi:hypothetical protein
MRTSLKRLMTGAAAATLGLGMLIGTADPADAANAASSSIAV